MKKVLLVLFFLSIIQVVFAAAGGEAFELRFHDFNVYDESKNAYNMASEIQEELVYFSDYIDLITYFPEEHIESKLLGDVSDFYNNMSSIAWKMRELAGNCNRSMRRAHEVLDDQVIDYIFDADSCWEQSRIYVAQARVAMQNMHYALTEEFSEEEVTDRLLFVYRRMQRLYLYMQDLYLNISVNLIVNSIDALNLLDPDNEGVVSLAENIKKWFIVGVPDGGE